MFLSIYFVIKILYIFIKIQIYYKLILLAQYLQLLYYEILNIIKYYLTIYISIYNYKNKRINKFKFLML